MYKNLIGISINYVYAECKNCTHIKEEEEEEEYGSNKRKI